LANWGITNLLAELYTEVLEVLKGRDLDAGTMFSNESAIPPLNAIRYNRSLSRFEEFDGTNWNVKTISVTGGGTGGTDAASARAALGIGTLGLQNAGAVNITGGTITGITSLGLTGHITFAANGTYNIGTSLARAGKVYIGGGLVVPVGVDKWVAI
jgi:hypothetical protein